jgi:hypothetical protein
MDMFVYGCKRVLRYFSLLNHTMVLYNTKSILLELGLTQKEFRQICVLSGTDYNINNNYDEKTLDKTLKFFKKYNKNIKLSNQKNDFYKWLLENENYIHDYDNLINVYNMFDLSINDLLKNFENIKIINCPIIKRDIQNILEEDGFVF